MRKLGSIGAIILLFIFLCSAASLLILSVTTYGEVTKSSKIQSEIRLAMVYLDACVRGMDVEDAISVRHVQGTDVLVCTEKEGKDTYETWLYGYNGDLYMISKRPKDTFKLREGKVVAQVEVVSISKVWPSLIKVQIKDEWGTEYTYVLSIRSSQRSVPYAS